MTQVKPTLRSVAGDLIAHETMGHGSSGAGILAVFRVTERLRPHLANLMGNGGFRALLARALVLAGAEVSWLVVVRVNAEGSLEGLEASPAKLDPAEILEGGVVVLAQLLGLLVALIGADLTARLVREIWPKLPSTSLFAHSEVQSDRAK